ncbi:MAG: sensor histidine kinase [Spirochaetaceae bacterium]
MGTGRRGSEESSKQLETRLHGLIDTCRLIHFVRNIDELLLLIVKTTIDMLDSEGCSIILRDRDRGDLVFHSVAGDKSSKLLQFRLTEGEGIAGHAIRSRQSVVSNDVATDPRFSRRADETTGFLTRKLICTPLIVNDECIGALEGVNKKDGSDYNDEDLILAEAVSAQIAVAIHNVQLTDAAIKAERLAAIGQAVTGVAHCVKNMLNGLESGLYILRADIEENYGKAPLRGLDSIGSSIGRLQDLVQDMLTYSKQRTPEYSPSNLNELVESVVELSRDHAKEACVELVFEPDRTIGLVVLDQKGIYRCVLNLVSNAVAASDEAEGVVTVRTSRLEDDEVRIEVTDNGIGMDQDTLDSVFTPFFSTKGSKGTGLGLSVTKKIVEEHGGRIDVSSTLGEGSLFTIHLPATGNPFGDFNGELGKSGSDGRGESSRY